MTTKGPATPDGPTLQRLLRRGVQEIIPEAEFAEALRSGRRLRLKFGVDPSRPDLTLGHVVVFRKLRQLQELGHQVVLIVGDWTAQIGDPSGRSQTRTMLTADEVRSNATTYMEQFFRVVDEAKTEIRWQTEWFGKFTLADVVGLTSRFTVAQMLQRDDFAKRFADHQPIAITEFLYPLLQAYDSVAIDADVEFGGSDQRFNLLVGRDLQQMMGQRPQQVFIMELLVGTDGKVKMSKSADNYIALVDPPSDMYGKVMSLPDGVVPSYFELLTDVSDEELATIRAVGERGGSAAMDVKRALGRELVAQFHGAAAADEADAAFRQVFREGGAPADVPELGWPLDGGDVDLVELLVASGLAPSKSEARRLIAQGGVSIDGNRVESERVAVADGALVRAGRRRFARIVAAR